MSTTASILRSRPYNAPVQISLPLQTGSPQPDAPSDGAVDHGVVYTQPWVVALILDLVGYRDDEDLAELTALEPSCGTGAFLGEMAGRLARSASSRGRDLADCAESIVAVELDPMAAKAARRSATSALIAEGVGQRLAARLAERWVRVTDFLTDPDIAAVEADVIVGNPPYVRPESIADGKLAEYRSTYRTMRGRADLYVAFFERGLHLLRRDGRLGFICADRWMRNAYGAQLRELVAQTAAVDVVIDMHHADAFADDVLAYPAITVFRRGNHDNTTVGRIQGSLSVADAHELARSIAHGDRVPPDWTRVDEWFSGSDPWPTGSPAQVALLRSMEERFPTLVDEGVRVGIGVATGADRVYITRDATVAERDRMLPLSVGKDTFSGEMEWSGRYLVNPWGDDGKLVDLDHYPKMSAYLAEHEDHLRSRHVGKKDTRRWFRTIDNVDPTLRVREKLLIPDIKGRLHPVLDSGETYPHHNLYYMVSERWPIEALGGFLLSDVAQFFVESYSVKMSGGFFRFQAQYLRRIRVPRLADVSQDDLAALMLAFRDRDLAAANAIANRLFGIDGVPA